MLLFYCGTSVRRLNLAHPHLLMPSSMATSIRTEWSAPAGKIDPAIYTSVRMAVNEPSVPTLCIRFQIVPDKLK